MPNHRSNKKGASRLISAVFVLLALAALYFLLNGSGGSTDFDFARLWLKLGKPLLRTAFFIAFGLLIAQAIDSLGWTAKLGILARPFVNWAKLPIETGAAFTTAFASGATANAFLYTAWQENKIGKKELILSNLLNASLPAYALHMPTTIFIILPLAGAAGFYYVLLTFLAALMRFISILVYGRLFLETHGETAHVSSDTSRPLKDIWKEIWDKFKVRARRMLLIILPVYLVVFLAAESGFFAWLKTAIASVVTSKVLPLEAMSVIIFSLMAEFTSGFAAAGALLEAGSLGVKEVVLALLIGNVISTPIRALRHQLPHYMGIYSPALGTKLLAIGQSVRIASVITVTIIFGLLY